MGCWEDQREQRAMLIGYATPDGLSNEVRQVYECIHPVNITSFRGKIKQYLATSCTGKVVAKNLAGSVHIVAF